MINRRYIKHILFAALNAVFLVNCGSQKHYIKRDIITEEHDRESITKPKVRRVSLFEDAIDNVLAREIDEYADLPRHVQNITNDLKQAQNTNALDEVPNSSWFTNRHGKNPMTLEELKRGPNRGSGPDMSAQILITAAKAEGVSPGFRIKDSKGDVYFIKFDLKGFPQLNTAAEVITTKFIYAAGYNTPENYLSTLDPKQIKIREGVTQKNKWGKDVPMTWESVEQILKKAESNPDGTYRVVASKLLEGEPLGPFMFANRRKDDPNDHIPHHHRRELRGYKVISAWLNNSDAKANNTLDMYTTENGKSFVKHYMIDFATSLGSGGKGAAAPSRGHKGAFDLLHVLKKIFTLGLYVEPYEKRPPLISPAVGYFDSDLFDPAEYAFIVPNPAFQKMTELDGFWAAKIVMSFTDEHIRAIVETGEYANQTDEDYIVKTLIERRDKTGRYWYGKVNPLDNFRIVKETTNHVVKFHDLAVAAGFSDPASTTYRYKIQFRGEDLTEYFFSTSETLPLHQKISAAIARKFEERIELPENQSIINLKIETRRQPGQSWSKPTKIFIYFPGEATEDFQIVAIERQN